MQRLKPASTTVTAGKIGGKTRLLKIKRVYEPASRTDGMRILVDRLWPRGISKERAAVKLWMKDIAPSTELREWFHLGVPKHWEEFRRRYTSELTKNTEVVFNLIALAEKGPVTLVYAARDDVHNHALVLLAFLQSRLNKR